MCLHIFIYNRVREVLTQPHTPRVLDHPSSLTYVWPAHERVSRHPPVLTVSGGHTDCWHPTVYSILPRESGWRPKQPGGPCWPDPPSLHSRLNPSPCICIHHRSARGVRQASWRKPPGQTATNWGKPRITTPGLPPQTPPQRGIRIRRIGHPSGGTGGTVTGWISCYSASTADLMRRNMYIFWKTCCLLQSELEFRRKFNFPAG